MRLPRQGQKRPHSFHLAVRNIHTKRQLPGPVLKRPCLASLVSGPSWAQPSSCPCQVKGYLGSGSLSPSCSNSQPPSKSPPSYSSYPSLSPRHGGTGETCAPSESLTGTVTKGWLLMLQSLGAGCCAAISIRDKEPEHFSRALKSGQLVLFGEEAAPKGPLVMLTDAFSCHSSGKEVAAGIQWVGVSDAATHSTIHKTDLDNQ